MLHRIVHRAALLFAALGAMLKRLGEPRGLLPAREDARERAAAIRKKPLTEKVEPHIGRV